MINHQARKQPKSRCRKGMPPGGLIICLLIFQLIGRSVAQDGSNFSVQSPFTVEHFTPANGLIAGKVVCVAQDSIGYLWIGTQDGLHRYDGYELRLYQYDPADSSSLSNNNVEDIYVDHAGTVWVGTWNGLNRYDPQTDSFYRYLHDLDDSTSLSGPMVIDIQEDAQNRLWIAMAVGLGGVCRYQPETDAFVRYLPKEGDPYSLTAHNPSRLYLDKSGDLWIGMGSPFDWDENYGGLNRYDPDRDGFIQYLHDPADPYSLAHNEIISLYEDREGLFWVATWGDGLQYMDREIGRFYPADENPNGHRWPSLRTRVGSRGGIRFLHEDLQGNLWIGSFLGGLDCFHPETGTMTHFSQGPAMEGGLTDLAVWSIFEDAQQGLWVSTWNGLTHIRPQPPTSEVIGRGEGDQLKLQDLHVEALLLDPQGQVWASTWAGLERIDLTKEKSRLIELGNGFPDRGGFSEIGLSLFQRGPGQLWVGNNESGIVQLDLTGRRVSRLGRPDPNQSFAINTIHQDMNGTIWIGSQQGLFYWDAQSDPGQVPPEQVSTPFKEVFSIAPGQGNNIWLGTSTGLFQLDIQSRKVKEVLPGYQIETMLNLGPEALWLGTNGQGLLAYNPLTNTHKAFTEAEGLPGQMIRSLITDQMGRLWMATNRGVAWMERENSIIRTFPPARIPSIYTFYPHSALTLPDGKLWFGGNGGILQVDPSQILSDPISPRPVIHSLKVFDQKYEALPGDPGNAYRLKARDFSFSHDENDLTFEFAGLHFKHPEDNTFRYKLVPYESEWREVGTQRMAIYPNLPPGTYTFQVQAANPDGVWSPETAGLEIVIRPPWWRTPWAYAVYGLLILGALFGFDRLQRRRLIRMERRRSHLREAELRAEAAEAQANQLQELDEAKARLYANITHEFRTPLTVILGMVDRIRGHSQERNLIQRNSQNLLRLINQLLDLSKLESGKLGLNLLQGDIIRYLQYLTESFYSMAREKDIRLLFYPEVEELVMDFDEAKIQHIVYNLLSNALKFTPGQGKVVLHATLQTRAQGDWLQLKVQDSGIGIAERELDHIFDRFYQADASSTRKGEGTGIGLSLTRELVELMEGDISVASSPGKGTTFTLRFPIRQNAPKLPMQSKAVDQPLVTSEVPAFPPLSETENGAEKPILVLIEDNADVATYITSLLQPQYHIHVERNGQAGIERVLEVIPDIVISDVMMPEKDGFEVCETLKQDERSSHIPIILLTARGTQEDRLTGLRGGADAYLTKPFEKEELFIRLEKLRELRQILQLRYGGDRQLARTLARKEAPNPEEAFLQKLIQVVRDRLDDPQLGVNDLCRVAKLSNTQVNRKLKALVGKTPSQFIRLIRLQQAIELLESSEMNISEVAYAVGFSDPNYFSRAFSEEFGYAPSVIRK